MQHQSLDMQARRGPSRVSNKFIVAIVDVGVRGLFMSVVKLALPPRAIRKLKTHAIMLYICTDRIKTVASLRR